MSDVSRHYATLELKPGASLSEIKRAYRELAQVWHPDRFADKPHLQARAHEKLAAINEAYRELSRRAGAGGAGRRDAAPPAADASDPADRPPQSGGAGDPRRAADPADDAFRGRAAQPGANGSAPTGAPRSEPARPHPAGTRFARAHAWVGRHALPIIAGLLIVGLLQPLRIPAGVLALACLAVRWGASRPTRRRDRLELAGGLAGAAFLLAWGVAAAVSAPGHGELAPAGGGRLRLRAIAIGEAHACGVAEGGSVYCWGANFAGQLGRAGGPLECAGAAASPVPCAPRPERVAGTARYSAVVAGVDHSCGLTVTGTVSCWGAGFAGQRGDGATADAASPRRVATDARFVRLSALGQHTCGLTRAGAAYCWGSDTDGQLGEPLELDLCRLGGKWFSCGKRPIRVPGGPWRDIAAGGSHSCALAADGAAYCWGSNRSGQLGSAGTLRCRRDGVAYPCAVHPVAVEGGLRFTRIAAGAAHTCALTPQGEAYCWGRNDFGQLGIGSTDGTGRPARVLGGGTFTELAAGGFHTCALSRAGAVLCWGRDADGQLRGAAPTERCGGLACRTRPAPAGLAGARSVSAGFSASCALAERFQGCWGRDDFGQLGVGRVAAEGPRRDPPPIGAAVTRAIAGIISAPHRLLWRVRSALEHTADRIQRPEP